MNTPSSGVRIREATASDAEAITTVRVAGWRAGYAGIIPDEVLDGLSAEPAASLIQRLVDPPPRSVMLVAEPYENDAVRGEVIGFVNAGPYRDDADQVFHRHGGEVRAIYVHPDHWGRRAGLALMTEAVARLRTFDLIPVALWTLEGNVRAKHFYERFGFTLDGAIKPYEVSPGLALPVVRYVLR